MAARLALVTGGSRGIGRAIVETLITDGWKVAFTFARDAEAASSVVASSEGRARAYQLDLRDRPRPDALVREIEQELGPIAGLVNNAGVRSEALLAMTPDRDFDAVLETNLTGTFRCCRAVLPGMISRRRGAIVSVSSLSAIAGVAGQTAYAASKAALLGLTRALAREVGRRNVRVNVVIPGFVATDLTAGLTEPARASLRAHECLPSGTSPTDVANVVAFLLSDGAAAVTGQAIAVDAGTSA